jgi:hypothetical protein
VLVPAHCLVNGATVTREPAEGQVTYVHVEVDGHEILMADGMAAESYFDDGDRAAFGNNVVALHGAAAPPSPPDFAPRARARRGVLPLLVGAETHAMHARLMRVAEDNGHALTTDPGLTVLCGDAAAEILADTDGDYVFLLPPGSTRVRLHTRRFVPAETDPAGGDQRTLGAAINRIVHDGEAIDLAGPGFGDGFLPPEGPPGGIWRWTSGEAWLDLPPRDYEATLEVGVPAWSRYWVGGDSQA